MFGPCVCVCVCTSYGADPLGDGLLVDLLPQQRVCVAPVDVVGFDPGAAAVFGFLPGDGHGGAVAAQQGDAVRRAGSRWDANKKAPMLKSCRERVSGSGPGL